MSKTSQQRITTITISYVLAVPASTSVGREVSQQKRIPIRGTVVQIVLFFPAGLSGTTGVFFTKEGNVVFPYEEGTDIALDDATLPFAADIPVDKGDVLTFKGNNSDTASHTVRAVVTIITAERVQRYD